MVRRPERNEISSSPKYPALSARSNQCDHAKQNEILKKPGYSSRKILFLYYPTNKGEISIIKNKESQIFRLSALFHQAFTFCPGSSQHFRDVTSEAKVREKSTEISGHQLVSGDSFKLVSW
ncbi:hypothetical protein TNCT_164331 [Trichonephila clavata]|uniref:Uncharacterized protein n=1 Tax=Trichonephila clavata TaxID=2740835 RepID=A0A8X6GNM8_TRICU|nr:hypothetical protein TNCT_164331 [Trichonephila clavata]